MNELDWDVDSETNECLNCGAHVLAQTAKVFGDNRDRLHACPNCTTARELNRKGRGVE